MNEMTCPKCHAPMRSYERNGVTIDQCSSCQGIFLDRGEFERLAQAEDVHYGRGAPAPGGGQYGGGQHGGGQYGSSQPGGFLGGLFGGEHGGRRGGHH